MTPNRFQYYFGYFERNRIAEALRIAIGHYESTIKTYEVSFIGLESQVEEFKRLKKDCEKILLEVLGEE